MLVVESRKFSERKLLISLVSHILQIQIPSICSMSKRAAPSPSPTTKSPNASIMKLYIKFTKSQLIEANIFPLPYTNHSSFVCVLFVCGNKSCPIRDLRLCTDGPSIDVASKLKLKFLGIVWWFPFMPPFSFEYIFSVDNRVVCSRGSVECFIFVTMIFVW